MYMRLFCLLFLAQELLLGSGREWLALVAPLPSHPFARYPNTTTVPEAHLLRNETIKVTLKRVAGKGVVLFTTLRLPDSPVADQETELLAMVSTFCYWLHESRVLTQTMLITTDERSVVFPREIVSAALLPAWRWANLPWCSPSACAGHGSCCMQKGFQPFWTEHFPGELHMPRDNNLLTHTIA